jgi:hypothetical protein
MNTSPRQLRPPLSVQALEDRCLPSTTSLLGVAWDFFGDGTNQLWEFQNGGFTNTGGFATKFSAF